MDHPWERQPGEPTNAYAALQAVLEQWPNRVIIDAYRKFSSKPNARVPGSWQRWAEAWKWDERLDAYERWKQDEASRALLEAHQEDYNRKLEEYRKAHETLARGSFNIMLAGVRALEDYVIQYVGDPRKQIKPSRKISSPQEAGQIAKIIGDFMRQAPAVWEAALGIPELKEQMEAMNATEE